ncbi:hypothetical protein OG601_47335 [Streptomyces sp. NBC_01239]|nr:hypothetical protein [Streptomyces sp. NBC_01239]MCX4816741.1 hypothetical protein [Streptomyces sp. NBC_01239]MCX4818189.1 hypothetical protein [Streptomyces sp. NBC_01239]
MRRSVIVALFVLAWMIGPVVTIQDGPVPPQPATYAPRGAHP